ncbi:AraC family transcriptional regulator [Paenibacillus donghaensis]|uniref:AraC family transcriptional regulator n=1 Tax=Paenibacillus donghaensis TaxID=414771 RepID=A0A2Z2KAA7_9BACL|nr:AraC family transcriptional regulator [Paenibacillus donghaensis]ASA19830.1 AraC family transcriptional regulator [Paenibacillus donghaensis]
MEDIDYDNGKETFLVSYRKARSHHMQVNHFHSTYEIFNLMSGKRTFFIKDRTMVVDEGHMIIIAPNVLHRTTDAHTPGYERLVINIHGDDLAWTDGVSPDFLQPLLLQEYLIVKCSLQERLIIEEFSRSIVEEIQEKKPGFELYVQTLTLQMLVICCRHVMHSSAEWPEAQSPVHERIFEVVKYINSHYMQELSLPGVAEKFYISPYYLSRFFKEATGFTFVEYLNSVRVKEAKQLLEKSSMKANLIARKVGFGSITHFGRVFKQVTGHAPLYYRKRKLMQE